MANGPTSQSGPPHPTVLVVDDDPAVVTLCQTILQQAGCSVLAASGSSEALKICKRHPGPIDVLVTDLVMPPPEFSFASSDNEFPHVHGHELASRAMRMRSDLRVILMSANIDSELAGYGIRKGVLPFLVKPFKPSMLITTLKCALAASPPTVESLQKDPPTGTRGADEWFD